MNIFWLDDSLELSAQYHCDRHVVKMLLEYTQLLSTAHHVLGSSVDKSLIYKPTHVNHPCALWVRGSEGNYISVKIMAEFLSLEYSIRYGKSHKTAEILKNLRFPPESLAGRRPYWTEPPLCMPNECKVDGDPIESYRNYYRTHKRNIASWTNRETPEWWH